MARGNPATNPLDGTALSALGGGFRRSQDFGSGAAFPSDVVLLRGDAHRRIMVIEPIYPTLSRDRIPPPMTTRPDPETDWAAEYVQKYVEDWKAAVERVREYGGDGYSVQAMEARRQLFRALLDTYGEPCVAPDCVNGAVVNGWTRATMSSPSEPIVFPCETCKGESRVIPERYRHLLDAGLWRQSD